MLIQGQVMPPPTMSATDGQQYTATMGKTLDLMVSELHGKYFSQNYAGNVALASLTTAAAVPVLATNTVANFAIWNPAGNNRAVSLIKLSLGQSNTVSVMNAIGWAGLNNAGNTVSATAPITAITALTVRSGKMGVSYSGGVLANSALSTLGTGSSIAYLYRWTHLSMGAAATTTAAFWTLSEEYDGTFIIPPNNAVFLVSSVAASGVIFMTSVIWEEIPWP